MTARNRLHANNDKTLHYLMGPLLRMLRAGGPHSSSSRDADQGYWTIGDMIHNADETVSRNPAPEKLLVVEVPDGSGGVEYYHCPDKSVSNVVWTGQIVKGMMHAGWCRRHIRWALEDPDNAGGAYWRWILARNEKSALAFLDRMMKGTYLDDEGRYLMVEVEETQPVEGNMELGWLSPTIGVIDSHTGETLQASDTEWYEKTITKYVSKKKTSKKDKNKKKDNTDYNTGGSVIVSIIQSSSSSSSSIDRHQARLVYEYITAHPASTKRDVKGAKVIEVSLVSTALLFLTSEGFFTSTKVKTGKPGNPPNQFALSDRTREEFDAWCDQTWTSSTTPSFKTVRYILGKLWRKTLTLEQFGGSDYKYVVDFLEAEGALVRFRQQGTDESRYELSTWTRDKKDAWMVSIWGDQAAKYIANRERFKAQKDAEEVAERKAEEEARRKRIEERNANQPTAEEQLAALMAEEDIRNIEEEQRLARVEEKKRALLAQIERDKQAEEFAKHANEPLTMDMLLSMLD